MTQAKPIGFKSPHKSQQLALDLGGRRPAARAVTCSPGRNLVLAGGTGRAATGGGGEVIELAEGITVYPRGVRQTAGVWRGPDPAVLQRRVPHPALQRAARQAAAGHCAAAGRRTAGRPRPAGADAPQKRPGSRLRQQRKSWRPAVTVTPSDTAGTTQSPFGPGRADRGVTPRALASSAAVACAASRSAAPAQARASVS
jgi:hypothetical protein